jgi:hypothetical protein
MMSLHSRQAMYSYQTFTFSDFYKTAKVIIAVKIIGISLKGQTICFFFKFYCEHIAKFKEIQISNKNYYFNLDVLFALIPK